ncbi:MAG: DUF4349 domain-containing protein [Erysipelotrichaceae bacterium]|nr:DUF4349 domain-containing protein [Erysipelotrichaceae bacterium]
MKENKLIDAIGMIKEDYIVEAHEETKKENSFFNKGNIFKLAIGLVCICLCVGILPNMFRMGASGSSAAYDVTAPMDGGYSYAGTTMTADYAMSDSMAYESSADSTASLSANSTVTKDDSIKKVITTGNMDIETMNLDELVDALSSKVEAYGGYIQNSTIYNYTYRSYDATYRIPADKYEEFVTDMGDMGNVTYYYKDLNDITDVYYDIDARLTSLKSEEAKVLEFYDKATTIEELMAVEERLSDIRYEIDSYETRIKNYDLLTDYSTLYVHINETKVYTETSESFFTRLVNSFSNGFKNFVSTLENIVLSFTYNIFLIIFLILVAFIGYRLYRRFRKNK